MPPRNAPEFWTRGGLAARLLEPLAWSHRAASAARRALVHPQRAPVPVVCIGNLVAGGAGKTPVALSLGRRLAARGMAPYFLSRGYGGAIAGPLAVDPTRHRADAVGDEPLLLAAVAPTWIARDRVAGARAAAAAGAGLILMDDGFQNPTLAKDLALLVIEGAYGFGNGRVIPAGPLREAPATALARADAVVLLGEDETSLLPHLGGKPVLRGHLAPIDAADWRAAPVLAFAGIARPEKFFRSLAAAGARVIAQRGFPDHHPYREAELAALLAEATAGGARLVTTEKDWVRLSPAWQARVTALGVAIVWQDAAALGRLRDRMPPASARYA